MSKSRDFDMLCIETVDTGYVVRSDTIGGVEKATKVISAFNKIEALTAWLSENLRNTDYTDY